MKTVLSAVLLSAAFALSPAQASDMLQATGRPVHAASTACSGSGVLSSIVRRFGAYHAPLDIVEIRDMQLRHRVARDTTHLVGRDYCGASALTSDGVVRPIWYLIESNFGYVGIGPSVTFCLRGLDPTYIYGADCASMK